MSNPAFSHFSASKHQEISSTINANYYIGNSFPGDGAVPITE